MPLTKLASHEFASGTNWSASPTEPNTFSFNFPNSVVLYLEASGMVKHCLMLREGAITHLKNAEKTYLTPEQAQTLFDKLPSLTAFFSKLDTAVPLLQSAIDKADFATAFDFITALLNLVPHAAINETALVEKVNRVNLTAEEKDDYFLKAAWVKLLKTTEALLKLGADIHANDEDALMSVACNGDTDILKLLLDNGANVHANNDYALRMAAMYGHAETVKLLLDHGANVHANNDEALRRARNYGHTEVVNILEAQITKEAAAQTPSPERPVANPVAGAIMGNGQHLNN